MRRIKVIDRAEEFPQIKELWEELASRARATRARRPASTRTVVSPPATLFQSYAWNEIAARVFAERERPYVVVAESDSGAAIIPGCVRRDSFSLLGEELFDYRDVISTGDAALTAAAWEKVTALGLPVEVKAVRGERSWAEMRPFAGAPYLPASKAVTRNKALERNLRLLGDAGCRSGHRVIGSSGDRLAALAEALPLDSASPAAGAPLGVTDRKWRAESISQMQIPRRCAPRNDKPEMGENDKPEMGDKAAISQIVRRMYVLKARQESGSLFRDPLRIEAVAQMVASTPTEVFTIENQGELMAAALTFVDGDVCRFYGTYYDERWARYSPGVSLLYRVIQLAQARGLDFDFMTGEQTYKMRFASEVAPLYIAQVPVMGRIAA